MRLLRTATAVALALAACGGRSTQSPAPASRGPATESVDAGPSTTTDTVPTIEVLAQRGATEAPTMREVARTPEAKAPIELQAGTADTCFRAMVAANEPVTAWFEAEDRDRRGAASTGTSGLVPPQGPVCFRKGSRLRFVIERPSASTLARAVVWASP